MSHRLLSPKRVVLGLVLLAALVVGGLGWVSIIALEVEASQREAAARADIATRERFALWRLDGFLLPVLGLENNRPYSHFFAMSDVAPVALDAAGDPTVDPVRIPSPLLTADLPPWMTLHFRLDPSRGWESPQVIAPGLAERLNGAPFGLYLTNFTEDRVKLLNQLRTNFPAHEAARALADQEQSEPDEPPFLIPVPQADDPILEKPTPLYQPGTSPGWSKPAAGPEIALGRGGLWCDLPAKSVAKRDPARGENPGQEAQDKEREQALKNDDSARGSVGQDNFQNKQQAQIPSRGRQIVVENDSTRDAIARKNSIDNVSQSRAGYEPGGKLQRNPPNALELNNGMNNPLGNGVRGNPSQTGESKSAASNESKEVEKQAAEWTEFFRFNFMRLREVRESQQAKDSATANAGLTDPGAEKSLADAKKSKESAGSPRRTGPSDALLEQRDRRRVNDFISLAKEAGPVAPMPEAKSGPLVVPVAVHIGPVRSRWLTGVNGTQLLLLVRAVKLNEKTIFQGAVLDWPQLKLALLDRLPDLLPQADLLPVPPTVDSPPEHTMSALPVQLVTGENLELPSAGWTPLRYGLLIAWAAALLAILAVAFGGRAIVAMSERRVRFASAVTHELRTPLTAMQLHLDLLNSGLITDEAKRAEYLSTITSEADRLNRLVANVLDFARLEKQSARASAKAVSVDALLEGVSTTWADRLTSEGFDLDIEATGKPDAAVLADERVIAQVLGNLIDNARKYAKAAQDRRIRIRATLAEKCVTFLVEDRGPGIPAHEQKSVFRPFTRGSETADSGGAGLGLSLARQWAELFGGTLTYQQAEPTGAQFLLKLPAVS